MNGKRNGFPELRPDPRKDFGYDPKIVNAGDVLPIDSPPIRRCAAREEVTVKFSRRTFRAFEELTFFCNGGSAGLILSAGCTTASLEINSRLRSHICEWSWRND